jgi:hypothetical protein
MLWQRISNHHYPSCEESVHKLHAGLADWRSVPTSSLIPFLPANGITLGITEHTPHQRRDGWQS